MSSATKTLKLLTYFSVDRPEIGLSQLCRLARRDKATTHRHLQALESEGFVEQNPATKQYRLGPALLGLAQTREATVPREAGAREALRALSDATCETAHVAVLSGTTLYALAACESPQHGTRVIVDIQTFPLHATASGYCALAFGSPDLRKVALADMRGFTAATVTDPAALDKVISETRATGFAVSAGSFESDAHSIGAPVFDHSGQFAGAVCVACVATRLTPALEAKVKKHLIQASRDITRSWGGTLPRQLETLWATTPSKPLTMEPAS